MHVSSCFIIFPFIYQLSLVCQADLPAFPIREREVKREKQKDKILLQWAKISNLLVSLYESGEHSGAVDRDAFMKKCKNSPVSSLFLDN